MKKTKEIEKYLRWKFKLRVLKFVRDHGSINEACEIFEISRTTYFNWKRKYDKYGEEGLLRKKRDSQTYWNSIDKTTVDLILKLREEHKLGTWRIKWYLERYHDINISESSVYRTLKRNNVKPLRLSLGRLWGLKDTLRRPLDITFKLTSSSYDLTLKKQKQLNAINKQLLMIVLELGR